MRLTPRGEKVVGIIGLFAFIMITGFAGYIETMP